MFKPRVTIPVEGRNIRFPCSIVRIAGDDFAIAAIDIPRPRDGIPVMRYMAFHYASGTPFDADSHDPDDCMNKLSAVLGTYSKEQLAKLYADSLELISKHLDEDLAYRKTLDFSGDTKRKGAVYLIKSAGKYKLGQSLNPEQRIAGMTLPDKPEILVIHYTPRYRDAERELHMRFADKRGHGEWFSFDNNEIGEVERAIRAF